MLSQAQVISFLVQGFGFRVLGLNVYISLCISDYVIASFLTMTVPYKKNQFEVANLRLLYESQNFERYKLCLKKFFIIFTA